VPEERVTSDVKGRARIRRNVTGDVIEHRRSEQRYRMPGGGVVNQYVREDAGCAKALGRTRAGIAELHEGRAIDGGSTRNACLVTIVAGSAGSRAGELADNGTAGYRHQ